VKIRESLSRLRAHGSVHGSGNGAANEIAKPPAIIEETLSGSSLWTGGAYGLEASIWAILMAAILSSAFIAIAIRRHEIVPFTPG